MSNENKFYSIELFAGCGGLALGLEQAGFKHSLLLDNDKSCINTLKKNRPAWNSVYADIYNLDFKKWRGKIALVTGGFPCQAFSQSGKRKGFEDGRGSLFFQFLRCIKEVRPPVFIGENVEGLKTHQKGNTLQIVLQKLRNLGYIVKWKVLNAIKYGVPQKRKRLILLGLRDDFSDWEKELVHPKETHQIAVTTREALENVPDSIGYEYSDKKKAVMSQVPPGGCWVDLPIDVQKKYMGASYHSGGGKRGIARRISWDEPCLTILTSPSQKQTDRCHPDEDRPFTVRECARFQTFPDDWVFTGSVQSMYSQVGNAVPVILAKKIGEQIMKLLISIQKDVENIYEYQSGSESESDEESETDEESGTEEDTHYD
jgi:DNA (cytosine-5)-methyltransferase 1